MMSTILIGSNKIYIHSTSLQSLRRNFKSDMKVKFFSELNLPLILMGTLQLILTFCSVAVWGIISVWSDVASDWHEDRWHSQRENISFLL